MKLESFGIFGVILVPFRSTFDRSLFSKNVQIFRCLLNLRTNFVVVEFSVSTSLLANFVKSSNNPAK